MTDLQQVAERLRKLYLFREASTEVLAATLDEIYGKGNRLNAYSDECCAAEDWLAERDPTPLTVEVLESLGADIKLPLVTIGALNLFQGFVSHQWLCMPSRLCLSTIGELRTLARLAGVELKEGTK